MQLRIAYEGGGYRLMVSSNGIDERPQGPRWTTPREASHFYDSYLRNHPQAVSPLRSADDQPGRSSAEPSVLTRAGDPTRLSSTAESG